jgi:hypothetical protein
MATATASLADVLQEIVGAPPRREGGTLKFFSPFREDERTPSFAVYPSTNTWFDWGMGIGGDVIEFFRKWLGCSYKEALCEAEHYALAGDALPPTPATPPLPFREGARIPLPILRDGKGELSRSGLPAAGCFVVRYKGAEYLAFPCPDRHHPEGLECRLISGNGERRLTFGSKSLWIQQGSEQPDTPFVVCESIFDCLASTYFLDSENLLAMNSVCNWRKAVEWLNANAHSVLLALDDDEPGRTTAALMKQHLKIPCRDHSSLFVDNEVKDFYRLYTKVHGGESKEAS